MIGTLTTPVAGTPLRFLDYTSFSPVNSTRSTLKMFSGGTHCCKASLHAVLQATPVAEPAAGRPETLYDVLRVRRNATPTEIKSAYRSLAKLYHPDASDLKQLGDRDFIQIHNAYATLFDPEARAMYDYDLKLSTGLRRRSGLYTAAGKSAVFYTVRRWDTDQCW